MIPPRKFAIVTCRRDFDRALLLINCLFYTGNDLADVMVITTDGDFLDGSGVGEVVNLKDVPKGHPQAVNEAFQWLCRDAHEKGYDFLFLEPDCTVFCNQILKVLGDDCEAKRVDVLGAACFSPEAGWHHNGVAYYRHTCWPKLKDRLAAMPESAPFDLWIVPQLWPAMIGPTNRIGHVEPQGHLDDWADPQWFIHHGDKSGEACRIVIKRCQREKKLRSPSWRTAWIPRSIRSRFLARS